MSLLDAYSDESFELFESDGVEAIIPLGECIEDHFRLNESSVSNNFDQLFASADDGTDFSEISFYERKLNPEFLDPIKEDCSEYSSFASPSRTYQSDEFCSDVELGTTLENSVVNSQEPETATPRKRKSKRKKKIPKSLSRTEEESSSLVVKSGVGKEKDPATEVKSHFIVKPHSVVIKPPSITSNISREMKYSTPMLQKQLKLALDRVRMYKLERDELLGKLDTSAAHAELEKLKLTLKLLQGKNNDLVEENRSLRAISLRQGNVLQNIQIAQERQTNEEDVSSPETQVRILLERVRRLSAKLRESQESSRKYFEKLESLSKENAKLRGSNVRAKRRLVEALGKLKSVSLVSEDSLHVNSEINGSVAEIADPSGVGISAGTVEADSIFNAENSMEEEGIRPSSKSSHKMKNIVDASTANSQRHGFVDYPELAKKLQKSLELQRHSFLRQIAALQKELHESEEQRKQQQEEIDHLEKQATSQKHVLRSLKTSFEGLVDGQKKLQAASQMVRQTVAEIPRSAPIPSVSVGPITMAPPSRPSSTAGWRGRRPVPKGSLLSSGEITSACAEENGKMLQESVGNSLQTTFLTSEQEELRIPVSPF